MNIKLSGGNQRFKGNDEIWISLTSINTKARSNVLAAFQKF